MSLCLTGFDVWGRQYFKVRRYIQSDVMRRFLEQFLLWHMKLTLQLLHSQLFFSLKYWDTVSLWLLYADLVEVLVYGLFLLVRRIALKDCVISLCHQLQWLSAAFRIYLGSTSAAPSETWPTRTVRARGWCKESPRSANAGAADGDASIPTFL